MTRKFVRPPPPHPQWWNELAGMKTFNGKKLREAREARRMPRAALADWALISDDTLARIEADEIGTDAMTAELLIIGVTGRKP